MRVQRVILFLATIACLAVTAAGDDRDELAALAKDGTYSTRGRLGMISSDGLLFTKTGKHVVGYLGSPTGIQCFDGTFEGTFITVRDAVNWDDDYVNGRRTGTYRFSPLREDQREEFEPLHVRGPVEKFPTGLTWLRSHESIVKEHQRWLDGCKKYFEHPEPTPCGDPELRGTDLNLGPKPKYHDSTKICSISEEPQRIGPLLVGADACSVEHVFGVMVRTPSTIAPADDHQLVEDCGVLELTSVTSPNKIRVKIDEENHSITNMTMRGHVFYPGRVVRQVVEENGEVKVVTTGTGTVTGATAVANDWLAKPIWFHADMNLILVWAATYAVEE